MKELYCTFCKNKCSLANPKCENGKNLAERIKNGDNPLEGRCLMCEKKCSYDNLGCSTGETMARIKGWTAN